VEALGEYRTDPSQNRPISEQTYLRTDLSQNRPISEQTYLRTDPSRNRVRQKMKLIKYPSLVFVLYEIHSALTQ
jgi:hypothetical protein